MVLRLVGNLQLTACIQVAGSHRGDVGPLCSRIPGDSLADSPSDSQIRRFIDSVSDSMIRACVGWQIDSFANCTADSLAHCALYVSDDGAMRIPCAEMVKLVKWGSGAKAANMGKRLKLAR